MGLASARALWDSWQPLDWLDCGGAAQAAVAVAASTVQRHVTEHVSAAPDDLVWSAGVLLQVAAAEAELLGRTFDESLVGAEARRAAAHGMPYLLLPGAEGLRRALGVGGASDVDDLVTLCAALALAGDESATMALARSLDAAWTDRCYGPRLFGRCHHRAILEVVQSILAPTSEPGHVSPVCCRNDVVAPGALLVARHAEVGG